jgi:branched-subunit amino acid ABC-type transport system permease component
MRILISLLDGLLIGFVYGLSAMGLSLIWGVMKVINLSHGAVMALGMFFSYAVISRFHPGLALPAVAVFGMLLGLLIYGVAVHRVISAPHLSSLLATFAVNMIIIGVGTAVFSTSPRNIDYSAGTMVLGDIRLPGTRLLAAGASILVTAVLYYFLYRTRSGKAIRAVANNRMAAGLMGISPTRSLALSFSIGTGLAALAGGLVATMFPFTILSGSTYEVKSFVICVLGGLGNPLGALLGGLILGGIEGVVPTFMPVSWVPVLEFGLFILVLVLRPGGLLGEK